MQNVRLAVRNLAIHVSGETRTVANLLTGSCRNDAKPQADSDPVLQLHCTAMTALAGVYLSLSLVLKLEFQLDPRSSCYAAVAAVSLVTQLAGPSFRS